MTEMNANLDRKRLFGIGVPLLTPPPLPYPPRYIIDPVAFFFALIAAPLVFTVLTFWILFIPVFALMVGGPAYLIMGTPTLLWYLRRNDGNPSDLGLLAFIVMAAALVPLFPAVALTNEPELLGLGLGVIGFGMIFGPAWAYTFGRLYQAMRRDFFAKARPL